LPGEFGAGACSMHWLLTLTGRYPLTPRCAHRSLRRDAILSLTLAVIKAGKVSGNKDEHGSAAY